MRAEFVPTTEIAPDVLPAGMEHVRTELMDQHSGVWVTEATAVPAHVRSFLKDGDLEASAVGQFPSKHGPREPGTHHRHAGDGMRVQQVLDALLQSNAERCWVQLPSAEKK